VAGPRDGLMGRFVQMRVVKKERTKVKNEIKEMLVVLVAAMRRGYSNLYGGRIRSSHGNY